MQVVVQLPLSSPLPPRLLSVKLGAKVMLQLCLWRSPFGTVRMGLPCVDNTTLLGCMRVYAAVCIDTS
jgi:hypothetical protein